MWPASKVFPKELFPVGKLPALGHVIWEMVDAGIDEITVVVRKDNGDDPAFSRSASTVAGKHARGGSCPRFEYMIRAAKISIIEQTGPYGNGTPLLDAVKDCNNPCVYAFADDVVFGENLTKGLIDAFRATGDPVLAGQTIAARDVRMFGVLECADGQTISLVNRFLEKPKHRDTKSRVGAIGRYLITKNLLEALRFTPPGRGGEIWLSDAYIRLLSLGSAVAAFRLTKGCWYTVGNPEGYAKAVRAAVRLEHTQCERKRSADLPS